MKKKLIEVALPLEAINQESAREKSIRHGHPSTLHLWWARRPLAACRAVLFASLVDDPSSHPDKFPSEEDQDRERQRLFRIIEELVKWESTTNEEVLQKARNEIMKSTGGNPPPVYDPFCGGGSIPLEAQRLGLKAYASDLNPVAVLITKAMIEIPPKFANQPPVHPMTEQEKLGRKWKGAQGLAEDVRYYGQWMREEAYKRIGHLYPDIELQEEQGGGKATVIAWLWARTVKCPNPACGAQMPLVRSFALSTKKGKQAWVEPAVDKSRRSVEFRVRSEQGVPPEGTVNRQGARCIVCGTPVAFDYIRSEGKSGRMSAKLMATVAEGDKGRIYLSPSNVQETIAASARPFDPPTTDLPERALSFRVQLYGMTRHADLFTSRQLVALTSLSDLISEVHPKIIEDAQAAGLLDNETPFAEGGTGVRAYVDAVVTYLAFAVDKGANLWSTITSWMSDRGALRETFARQAIPMVWDYAEANPFSNSGGNFIQCMDRIAATLDYIHNSTEGYVNQKDALTLKLDDRVVVSTDPPYYDNIGYADLSDFFYVWLRRSLSNHFPKLFQTLLVPKSTELIASPYRFGGSKVEAEQFFREGMKKAFTKLREFQYEEYPITIFYAFKQNESKSNSEDVDKTNSLASTGWETMLEGLIGSGLEVHGTWPMRTESPGRAVARGTNALASSILLVCRSRRHDAPITTRRDFLNALKAELPKALAQLQRENIAPVDLAQAAIGPGMAVFSRYSKVIEADGSTMGVRDALALINQVLDEFFAEQESEYDAGTRWALAWFEQFGIEEGQYGAAETLATAKNIAVSGLVEAGILQARGGKVRLLRRKEYNSNWDPLNDPRLPIWELTQRLILSLENGGERGTAEILSKVGGIGETARDLAYRLYSICDRKGWAQEALAYNSLVVAWTGISRLAQGIKNIGQTELFE